MVDYGSLFDHIKADAESKAQAHRNELARIKKESADRHAAMMKPLVDKVKPALDDMAYQLSNKGVTVRRDFIDRLCNQPDKPTNFLHFQLVTENVKGRIFIFQVERDNASGMYIEDEKDSVGTAKGLFSTHINSVNANVVESVTRRAVEEFARKIVDETNGSEER